ncbi:hypothetical protein DMH25_19100 [Streptomyces sp. WAC 01325]|uniref:hypothetical protein n=1 Tax=Streptomyces TaxID=1883 RepID=UPI000F88F46A|nr:hypothetical protein [Streptomyces sp. WAC 01325]RSN06265.1 hypothetical protein DMH25_19100 [Streptomyces sp. WAC 01325]WCH94747.1 hypothetical protein POD33_22445 [Streptomyces moderatus]
MGVFARLFRRSKATEEASTVEVQADTPTAEQAAEEETAEAKESVEAKAEEAARPTTSEAVAADGDDGVEIPKQQSADEAADSEAGESART